MKYFLFIIPLIFLFGCSIDSTQHKNDINNTITTISFSGESNQSPIKLELNWAPRTLSGADYIFGRGNPKETDKSIEELKEWYISCKTDETKKGCHEIPYYENLADTYDEKMNTIYTGSIARMTPEIEYLVYTFLSDPIIRNSSIKCASSYWKDDHEGALFYNNETMHEDMGEIIPENWWNPYYMDINQFIMVNQTTGRKELNIDPIWTLRTQISFPAVAIGKMGGNYTNLKLTECLEKNHLLMPLQLHVNYYYDRFLQLWRGI